MPNPTPEQRKLKPKAEARVLEILAEMEAGGKYAAVFEKIRSKSHLSNSTFAEAWREAQRRHEENLRRRAEEVRSLHDTAALQQAKKNILTKEEALALLSDTARGKPRSFKPPGAKESIVIAPSYSESTRAIQLLSELQGWNLVGDDPPPSPGGINVYNPTADQFETILKEAREATKAGQSK